MCVEFASRAHGIESFAAAPFLHLTSFELYLNVCWLQLSVTSNVKCAAQYAEMTTFQVIAGYCGCCVQKEA